jgi:hypothetical protein
MKLEEAASKQKKKGSSDFLAPPPASLLGAKPLTSATKPLGAHQPNNKPMLVSTDKIHNNLQSDAINVDEDNDGKENICPLSVKKHCTTVADTDLFSMFISAIKNVDPTTSSITTMMQQCTQFLELAEQHHHEAEE